MTASAAGKVSSGTVSGMSDAQEKSSGRDWLTTAVLVVGVLVLLAGLATALTGLVAKNSAERTARDRDAAIDVASQVLVNAYSFDFKNVDHAIAALADASTGDFLAQQQQWGPQVRTLVVDQQAVTKAEIGNAAVQAFDDKAGTATVLFVFTAQSERKDQPSVTGRQAARVDAQRVDGSWKISGVTPVGVVVPVGNSSASVQGLTDPTTSAKASTSTSTTAASPTSKPALSSTPAAPAGPSR